MFLHKRTQKYSIYIREPRQLLQVFFMLGKDKYHFQTIILPFLHAMEFLSSFSIITFFLICSLLLLAKNYKQIIKAKNPVTKLPPGPWKLPVIGNLHQLAAAASLPHHALGELAHKYGSLLHLQLGEISAVVVSSPEMAKEIMKTHDLAFAQRPELLSSKILAYGSTDIAFAPYGEYWRQMRKICTLELLSAKRVQSFSFVREDEVKKLIESIKMSTGTPINLTARVFSLVSTIVCRAAFGKKNEDEDELLSLLKPAVELTGGFDLADLFPSLVDVLLRVQQTGNLKIPITDDNIKAVIWDVFSAGTDTLPLLLPRETMEPCNIGGYEIPEKTKIIVNTWALGRDPECWCDAESFLPERFQDNCFDFKGNNFEYIPFGAGRRICPGASFALANIELPLASLLYHFNWELPNGMKSEDLDMTEAFGLAVGRKNSLYLIPTPYYPSLHDGLNICP